MLAALLIMLARASAVAVRAFASSASVTARSVRVIDTVEDMRRWRTDEEIAAAKTLSPHHLTVGFVPTMGALHAGHMSLINSLAGKVDTIVVSIFVNPAQFAPHEDFDSYPRQLQDDIDKLMSLDCSDSIGCVFAPTKAVMYPTSPEYRTYVDPLEADDAHEGAARPGFFRGVATVVTKLFSTVRPTHAAFGQKDAYQCIVVRQLSRDLNLGVDVAIVPTMREEDGLAMSSRNAYLNQAQRRAAPALLAALHAARDHVLSSVSSSAWTPESATAAAQETLAANGMGEFGDLQYLSVASAQTGRPVDSSYEGALVISAAAPMGTTRLIDNIVVVPGQPGLSDEQAADYLGR